MKIIIKPEKDEEFEKIEYNGVTDYVLSLRTKNNGIPESPRYLRFGQYDFIYQSLCWQLEMTKYEMFKEVK